MCNCEHCHSGVDEDAEFLGDLMEIAAILMLSPFGWVLIALILFTPGPGWILLVPLI